MLQLNPNRVELMDYAENYFKDSKSTGEWLKLTEEEKKIIALKAQIHRTTHKRDDPLTPKKEKEKKERKQCKGEKERGKAMGMEEHSTQLRRKDEEVRGKDLLLVPKTCKVGPTQARGM